jgi:putative (di)nucleoside polyphosphate hydrolase
MVDGLISCGVIVTDGKKVLGCLPTGRVFREKNCLDLPKGRKDSGETNEECAIRELFEETGIVAFAKDLWYLGTFKYRPHKDLVLYTLELKKLPDPKTLKCDSVFEDHQGEFVPEHSGYELVAFTDIEKRFFLSLGRIISANVSKR